MLSFSIFGNQVDPLILIVSTVLNNLAMSTKVVVPLAHHQTDRDLQQLPHLDRHGARQTRRTQVNKSGNLNSFPSRSELIISFDHII